MYIPAYVLSQAWLNTTAEKNTKERLLNTQFSSHASSVNYSNFSTGHYPSIKGNAVS